LSSDILDESALAHKPWLAHDFSISNCEFGSDQLAALVTGSGCAIFWAGQKQFISL
jgi:hypothetical protein